MANTKDMTISIAHADHLESKLYEIESAILAMGEILKAGIDAESALLILGLLRKSVHQSFEGCTDVMHEARLLRSARGGVL